MIVDAERAFCALQQAVIVLDTQLKERINAQYLALKGRGTPHTDLMRPGPELYEWFLGRPGEPVDHIVARIAITCKWLDYACGNPAHMQERDTVYALTLARTVFPVLLRRTDVSFQDRTLPSRSEAERIQIINSDLTHLGYKLRALVLAGCSCLSELRRDYVTLVAFLAPSSATG